jgi:TatD DNase family protein
MARRVLDMGFYISITGVVTFKNAGELRDVVSFVPLARLMVETDSPFLSPVPFRGRKNEPARVRLVAEKIAGIKDISTEEVASCTSSNARVLFGLPRP